MALKYLLLLIAGLTVSSAAVLDYKTPRKTFEKIPDASCQINVNGGLQEPQPLIVQPGTENFLYPNSSTGILTIDEGGQIEVLCVQSFSQINAKSLVLTCAGGTKWIYNGITNDFKYFTCTQVPYHQAVRSGDTCYNNASLLNIGFPVEERFFNVFNICFDEVLERTHYVEHEFTPAHVTYQSGYPRPNWFFNGYFQGKNVDSLYTRVNQQNTLAKILGSLAQAKKYVPDGGDFFLSRGHLAAKTDFIYGVQHRATFWMMNIAPQWQVFNGNNWLDAEVGIREFVASRGITVDVFTGTYGTITLKDVNNEEQEIYLAFDDNNNGLIPAPKIYYKILVDRVTRNGIAIIGVNNPYLTLAEIERDYLFCKDVSSQINWIKWDRTNIQQGYSYACDVNDFFQVVKHLPDLVVEGLLV